jgi:hypothetical protein
LLISSRSRRGQLLHSLLHLLRSLLLLELPHHLHFLETLLIRPLIRFLTSHQTLYQTSTRARPNSRWRTSSQQS